MEDRGQEIGWDGRIEKEGADFEPVPAGTYTFVVHTMDRGRFAGSERMAPCNMANLDLIITDRDGNERHVFDTLYLNTKAEWRISQFFLCIGQKKKGEPLRPNWNEVVGSSGKAEIIVNSYKDKDGNPRKNNRVDKYLPYEPKKFTPGSF